MLFNSLFPPGLLRDRRLIHREWITALALSVMVNLLVLIQPVFMLHVYDYVLPSQSRITLLLLTAIALFVVIMSSAMDYMRSRLLIDMSREIDMQIRERAFEGAFEQAVQARRFSRAAFVQDLEALRGFVSGPSATALMDLPWTPLYILALFLLSPWLAALALIVTAGVVIIALLNERALKPIIGRANNANQVSARLADDILQSASASHAMGFTRPLLTRWAAATRYAARLGEKAALENTRASAVARSVRMAMQIMSLALAAYLVLNQKMTGGSIVAASLIGARAVGPIENVITGWRRFASARMSLQTLQGMVFSVDADTHQSTKLPAPKGALKIDSVSVADKERQVMMLSSVSFDVPAGAFVGLVGRSGSGKSTLVQLIAGAAPPTAGKIRIDGAELDQWRREDLGAHIGYLPQDTLLHRGTVAENIRRFGPVDDAGVIAAAKLSGAHDFIQLLPNGYDTDIGDGGSLLSGGQRQRLGLARAVYGDPTVLVFDEPTAHLDGEAEALFWRMIEELRRNGKTILLVTHKASYVRNADLIAVLFDGRLHRIGPPNEVLPSLISGSPQPAKQAS